MSERQAHSAHMVWSVYFYKAILKLVPALGKKSNAQAIFTVVMVLIAMLGSIGGGIYIDGYGVHPPAVYTGVCASPAFIKGGSCLQTTVSSVTVNGAVTYTTVTEQAGSIVLNGTGK